MKLLNIKCFFREKLVRGSEPKTTGTHCASNGTGKNAIYALVITVAAMAFFWLLIPPRFAETNDDLIMASFAYGYMGEYSTRLIFINILVGYALNACITLLPQVPWYTVFQCTLVFLGFSVLVFLLLQKFRGPGAVFPLALFLIFFGYQFFSSLQFTKTAAIASIAGFLLMFYAVRESRKWYTYILAGILILSGSLYRFRMFELLLLLMFGIGLIMVWSRLRTKQWREIIRICIPFAVIIAICFSFYALDRWSYNHSEEWKDFWDYNYLRDNIQNSRQNSPEATGFPDYDENQELYESLNITRNDYNLYRSGNFADTELFTKEVLEQLVDAKGSKKIDIAFFKSFFTTIGSGILAYSYFPALGIAFLVCLLGCSKRKKEAIFLFIYEAVAFTILQLYFFYRGRYLQSRVDVCIIFALIMILVLYVWDADVCLPTRRKTAGLLAGMLLILSGSGLHDIYQTNASEREASENTEIHELITSDPEHFYLYYVSWRDFPDKMFHVWQVAEKGCGSNRSALGTWRVSTLMVQDKLKQYGITNPYRDMVENPDVFLLCASDAAISQVMTHIYEHYAEEVYPYLVKRVENDKYDIYRVTSGEPRLDTSQVIDGTELLNYRVSYRNSGGYLELNGYLYQKDTSSFATNIYFGITYPNGWEQLYYGTQYQSKEFDDNMNGEYGAFTRTVDYPEVGSTVKLYLETADGLYVVSVGEIPEYVFPSARVKNRAQMRTNQNGLTELAQ